MTGYQIAPDNPETKYGVRDRRYRRFKVVDGGGNVVRGGMTHRQAWAELQRQNSQAHGWKRRPYPGVAA